MVCRACEPHIWLVLVIDTAVASESAVGPGTWQILLATSSTHIVASLAEVAVASLAEVAEANPAVVAVVALVLVECHGVL